MLVHTTKRSSGRDSVILGEGAQTCGYLATELKNQVAKPRSSLDACELVWFGAVTFQKSGVGGTLRGYWRVASFLSMSILSQSLQTRRVRVCTVVGAQHQTWMTKYRPFFFFSFQKKKLGGQSWNQSLILNNPSRAVQGQQRGTETQITALAGPCRTMSATDRSALYSRPVGAMCKSFFFFFLTFFLGKGIMCV